MTRKGRLFCWGGLRRDDVGFQPTRIDVPGRVSTVDLGNRHSCATTEDGDAYCWGSNLHGTLGRPADGSSRYAQRPVRVRAHAEFREIAVARSRACGVTRGHRVYCWGRNTGGTLGVAGRGGWAPMRVPVEGRADAIVASRRSTCVRTREGAIWCWGRGAPSGEGKRREEPSVPRRVGSEGWEVLAGNDNGICAATGSRRKCWPSSILDEPRGGADDGSEETEEKSPGSGESKLPPIRELAVADRVGCARTKGGDVWCWGDNEHGTLGDGTTKSRGEPKPIDSDASFVDVDVGFAHACAVGSKGGMYCRGGSRGGRLGFVDIPEITVDAELPEESESSGGPRSVAGEEIRFFAQPTPRSVCFGTPDLSMVCKPLLGRDDRLEQWRPFRSISFGGRHVCLATSEGRLRCAGRGWYGQLGTGERSRSRRFVAAGSRERSYRLVASGPRHVCGLTDGRRVRCWGMNRYGEAGGEGETMVLEPGRVDGDRKYRDLAAGRRHTCAVDQRGAARCWGWNRYGQLGDGSTESSTSPVAVAGGHRFESVTSAGDHTCGRTADGDVYCWGRNDHGQLGPQADESSGSPVQIPLEEPALSIGAGRYHVCARTDEPALRCWGIGGIGLRRLASGAGVSSQLTAGTTTCVRDEKARIRACFTFDPQMGIRVRSLAADAASRGYVATPRKLEWPD